MVIYPSHTQVKAQTCVSMIYVIKCDEHIHTLNTKITGSSEQQLVDYSHLKESDRYAMLCYRLLHYSRRQHSFSDCTVCFVWFSPPIPVAVRSKV